MGKTVAGLLEDVHRRIGRNLLRFEEIEHQLKFILPYIHPKGSKAGFAALQEYRKRVESKSFGLLVEELLQSSSVDSGFFKTSLKDVVSARNDLVHHFFKTHLKCSATVEGLESILSMLDRQFDETHELTELVQSQMFAVVLALLDTHEMHEPDFPLLRRKLLEKLPPGFEYIDKADPTKTIWRSTRIVKLLKAAEAGTKELDGMTHLAHAGNYIRRHSPGLDHKAYGVAKLRDILAKSQLFEVQERSSGPQKGKVVLYKSKPDT